MKKGFFKRGLVLGIMLLFVGAGVIQSTGIRVEKTSSTVLCSRGYIQDLIDNASSGDTIYIPNGIYYEHLRINKSINLVGEDKNTTIIDGGGNGTIIYITSNDVTISGFTIQNGGDGIRICRYARNTIKDNIIKSNNGDGLSIEGSDFNRIFGNNINSNNGTGISVGRAHLGIPGLYVGSGLNVIEGNNISNNEDGIYLLSSNLHRIIKNNFIDNCRDAYFVDSCLNLWSRNYWNKPRIFPKIIFGKIEIQPGQEEHWIDWVNIDWHPAKEPNDIYVPGGTISFVEGL